MTKVTSMKFENNPSYHISDSHTGRNMTVEDVARETGYTPLFIREWIADWGPEHPFGVAVTFPGSKRRTFRINEAAFRQWQTGGRKENT